MQSSHQSSISSHEALLIFLAISYSIISPLVLGFATIGFACIYLATRYNALYVLTNNVDTRGAAYGRALQQLMTGVYISEVCLIGLFAINTSPGPLVLMAVFLLFTAIYHAVMRNALRPLTLYLPTAVDGEDQFALFSHSDMHTYDSAKAGAPPTEVAVPTPKAMSARKASIFSRIFDPRRFASYTTVRALVPNYAAPQYIGEEEAHAYFNPAITSSTPRLWIAKDNLGISTQEVKDSSEVVDISDEYARFDEKGKIVWDVDRLESVPIYEKRIDY